jgi:rhamnosyltransferase
VISVVVPVRNGGPELVRCLEAIAQQDVEEGVETIVVDNGSGDGSAEAARRLGARVLETPADTFTYGGSRNLGAAHARGELLVFTSHDAYAASNAWLRTLTAPLAGDARLAGVYGRQLPQAGASPPERYFLGFLYGEEPRLQHLDGHRALTMRTTLFSNVNAAIPRALWEAHPFAEDIIGSEDQEWSVRMLRAGYAIRYEPAAAVHHSHRYTLRSAFRRFFDSGVAGERTYLADERAARRVLREEAVSYARGELAWLWRTNPLWLPYAVVYEATKFLGLQLGARHRLLPKALKRRVSVHPGYWDRAPG